MAIPERERIFKELFSSCYSRLYYIAVGLVVDASTAEDIVEEVFVRIWERIHNSTQMPRLTYSLLSTMVFNLCQDHLRHEMVHQRYANYYLQSHTEGLMANDGLREERLQKIDEVRDRMPEKTRRIMDLCYFENKRYEEVAAIVGLSKDGVRKQMIKALGMLREAFLVNKGKIITSQGK